MSAYERKGANYRPGVDDIWDGSKCIFENEGGYLREGCQQVIVRRGRKRKVRGEEVISWLSVELEKKVMVKKTRGTGGKAGSCGKKPTRTLSRVSFDKNIDRGKIL